VVLQVRGIEMWNQAAGEAWVARNSHVSAWLSLVITALAVGGIVALLSVPDMAGLYIPPTIARLAIGTFDGINALFFFMWASMFQLVSIHDGLQYRLKLRKKRVSRSRAADALILVAFPVVAVLWGVIAVYGVYAGRATDPMYLRRLPEGVPAGSLQHGVTEVMTTYFILVALVLILIVIARRFNPVDFDEYDRRVRAIVHLPAVERAA